MSEIVRQVKSEYYERPIRFVGICVGDTLGASFDIKEEL